MTASERDVIAAKFERAFESVDTDHNGYADWSDYRKLVERYLESLGIGKDDPRARALYAFREAYWRELLRHAGVDGDRLTKDQYVSANRLAGTDTTRLDVIEGAGHAVFDIIDADGDGRIGRDETARFLKDVWKIDVSQAADAFARLDTDGDGAITRQEFTRAMREHFLSTDPDAPGSLFFGQA